MQYGLKKNYPETQCQSTHRIPYSDELFQCELELKHEHFHWRFLEGVDWSYIVYWRNSLYKKTNYTERNRTKLTFSTSKKRCQDSHTLPFTKVLVQCEREAGHDRDPFPTVHSVSFSECVKNDLFRDWTATFDWDFEGRVRSFRL